MTIGGFPPVPIRIEPPSLRHPHAATTEIPPGELPAPESVSEVGVGKAMLEDLALKILCIAGSLSLRELAERIHLGGSVVDELFRRLRAEKLCEVTGMVRNVPQIAITSSGRSRALELLSANQYTGAAPVSLESYVRQVRQQSVQHVDVHPLEIQRAFAHLVLDAGMLQKLGTALNSGHSIFLYGPSGAGKTTIATTLSRVLARDGVWIPYAVEVDGEIISLYAPMFTAKSMTPFRRILIRAGYFVIAPRSWWAGSSPLKCWSCKLTRSQSSIRPRCR